MVHQADRRVRGVWERDRPGRIVRRADVSSMSRRDARVRTTLAVMFAAAQRQFHRNRKGLRLRSHPLIQALSCPAPLNPFDRRITPARPDLAAASLRGKVEAARFVEGRRRRVVDGAAPLRRAPSHEASLETEALYGESVIGLRGEMKAGPGRSWSGMAMSASCPRALSARPLRRPIGSRPVRSFAYPGPSIKLPPVAALSLGARLAIIDTRGDFGVTADGWHIYGRHLAPLDAYEPDFVAVAERFLEVPYLWGGRTSQGIDCSGLDPDSAR